VAKKVSNYQMIKKSYGIILKPANEIRLFVELKNQPDTKIWSVTIKYSVCDLLLDINNYAWPTHKRNASNMWYRKWCQCSLWHQLAL